MSCVIEYTKKERERKSLEKRLGASFSSVLRNNNISLLRAPGLRFTGKKNSAWMNQASVITFNLASKSESLRLFSR